MTQLPVSSHHALHLLDPNPLFLWRCYDFKTFPNRDKTSLSLSLFLKRLAVPSSLWTAGTLPGPFKCYFFKERGQMSPHYSEVCTVSWTERSGLFGAIHLTARNIHFSQQSRVPLPCPEEKEEKKLWQITAHHCLSPLNQSVSRSLVVCTALRSTEAASAWIRLMKKHCTPLTDMSNMGPYHSPATDTQTLLLLSPLKLFFGGETRANTDIW